MRCTAVSTRRMTGRRQSALHATPDDVPGCVSSHAALALTGAQSLSCLVPRTCSHAHAASRLAPAHCGRSRVPFLLLRRDRALSKLPSAVNTASADCVTEVWLASAPCRLRDQARSRMCANSRYAVHPLLLNDMQTLTCLSRSGYANADTAFTPPRQLAVRTFAPYQDLCRPANRSSAHIVAAVAHACPNHCFLTSRSRTPLPRARATAPSS